jgi:peptidoglycan/LPS O-acetylase OafA/YrhL
VIAPAHAEPAQWIALTLLLNVFILPVVSQTHFGGALFPTNGPVWSLFYEFLVNLAWSISASFRSSIVIILLLTIASGAVLCATMHQTAVDDLGWGSDHWLGATCRVLFSFMLGTVIYRFHRVLPSFSRGSGIVLPALATAALLVVLGMPWFEGEWDALAIFLFFPAILTLGIVCGREPDSGIRSFLGEISYPLYAVHFPIFLLLSGLRTAICPSLNVAAAMSIGVLLALVAAVALNRFDRRLRLHLSRKSTFAVRSSAGRCN